MPNFFKPATGANAKTLTVGKAVLTVTAQDNTPVLRPEPAAHGVVHGLQNGETLATSDVVGAPACSTPATPLGSVAGTYAITCTAGTLTSTNYSFTFAPGVFTVTKEDTTLEYSGDTLKSTGSTATNSTTSLQMAAVIREAADGNLGDKLGTTSIKFTLYKFTDTAMSTPSGHAPEPSAQQSPALDQQVAWCQTLAPTTMSSSWNWYQIRITRL